MEFMEPENSFNNPRCSCTPFQKDKPSSISDILLHVCLFYSFLFPLLNYTANLLQRSEKFGLRIQSTIVLFLAYNYSYPSHMQYLLHVCLKNSKSLIESRGQSWNIRSCDIRQVQLWFIVILRPVTSKDTQYLPRANPTYSDEADRNTTTKILEKEINGRCIGGIGPWQFWKLGKCCLVPLTSEKECSMIYLTLVLLFGRSYTGRCSLLLLAPYSWRFFF